MNWAKVKPSDELNQAIETVMPIAEKLGMSRDDVRGVFADMAGEGLTDVPMATLAIRKAMEEIQGNEKAGPQGGTPQGNP